LRITLPHSRRTPSIWLTKSCPIFRVQVHFLLDLRTPGREVVAASPHVAARGKPKALPRAPSSCSGAPTSTAGRGFEALRFARRRLLLAVRLSLLRKAGGERPAEQGQEIPDRAPLSRFSVYILLCCMLEARSSSSFVCEAGGRGRGGKKRVVGSFW
jgi:hypothetical protein